MPYSNPTKEPHTDPGFEDTTRDQSGLSRAMKNRNPDGVPIDAPTKYLNQATIINPLSVPSKALSDLPNKHSSDASRKMSIELKSGDPTGTYITVPTDR